MKIIIVTLLGLFCSRLSAHPVAYEGSWGLMGYQSPMLSHSQINHSLKYWFAAGVHHIRRPNFKDKYGTFASTNFLLKRWNAKKFQANIYANVGLGHSQLGKAPKTSSLGLLQFDVEDRHLYFLAKYLSIFNDKDTDFSQSVVRAGIAPYVVNFDGIHSWIIFEWQNSAFGSGEDTTDLTPFLRVFYKNLLFEIGQSFDGVSKFNYITHF